MPSIFLVIMLLVNMVNADPYKYATHPDPVEGDITLTCIGIKYQNVDRHTTGAQAKAMCNKISAFYKTNSRGLLNLKTSGYQVNVPFNGNAKNVNAAENYAMNKYPKSYWYAIVTMFNPVSHAGGGVATLQGTLTRDAEHETGHLTGLGHAGVYKVENGNWVLDAYGDGQSVMGRFPASGFTAPQYYGQGWLPLEEAALYQAGQIYQLKRINDFFGSGLATVIVRSSIFRSAPEADMSYNDDPDGMMTDMVTSANHPRDLYISFPTGCKTKDVMCVAMHLSDGKSSQKIVTLGNEYYDEHFTGAHVKIVGKDKNKLNVTIDFNARPTHFVNEVIDDEND